MKLAYIFGLLKNMSQTEYGMNIIHNVPIGRQKIFGYINEYGWKLQMVHFMLFYVIFKIQFKKHYTMSKNL